MLFLTVDDRMLCYLMTRLIRHPFLYTPVSIYKNNKQNINKITLYVHYAQKIESKTLTIHFVSFFISFLSFSDRKCSRGNFNRLCYSSCNHTFSTLVCMSLESLRGRTLFSRLRTPLWFYRNKTV